MDCTEVQRRERARRLWRWDLRRRAMKSKGEPFVRSRSFLSQGTTGSMAFRCRMARKPVCWEQRKRVGRGKEVEGDGVR